MKYFGIALISFLTLMSCSSDENTNDDWGFPVEEPTTVRLKHLLTTAEVMAAAGNFTAGWDVNDLNVTNVGEYPTFPYIYYYRLEMTEIPETATGIKIIDVQAGGGVDADVTLEQFLAERDEYVAVNNQLLANYPNTYIVKNIENDFDEWMVYLYTPHRDQRGNRTMHSVCLIGRRTPPPPDEAAVTTLLNLVERHD